MKDRMVDQIKAWFAERRLNHAVVGYSGGVDSTTTILLLQEAGIDTTSVIVEAPHQKYSGPGGVQGAMRFANSIEKVGIPHLFRENEANEAALPIMRVAAFYGVAARLRDEGRRPVVVGTANLSEAACLGFWGKASDGAQDFYPISHLTKREVYELARALCAPAAVLDAVPSGDLLFSNTNDYKMIGATYEQIDNFIEAAESGAEGAIDDAVMDIDHIDVFFDNIRRNSFKYDLPFPGFHLSSRLEEFRVQAYPRVLKAMERHDKSIGLANHLWGQTDA